MKKILFYTTFITVGGGLQKVLIDYLKGLDTKGYKIDLICDFNMGNEVQTFEDQIPKNIKFDYIKSQGVSKFVYYFRTLGKKCKLFNLPFYLLMIILDFYYYHTKVKKIVQNGDYDITVSFYQFLPSYLTSLKSSKHIIWLHGSVDHFFGGIKNIFKSNYEKKLNKYDYIVTIADEMKEQLENFYPNLLKSKVKRIYNPFDFDEISQKMNAFDEMNETEKNLLKNDFICSVGRLDEGQKDFLTLINAYELLYKHNQLKEKLYIVGDGPSRTTLENVVKNKKLESQIVFLGKKTNPYIWMKNAKLFVLSSKFEGFGLVLVEAMKCETFVVSSNCKTGPTEILLNQTCGDLFEIGNYKELANKLHYILSDTNYKQKKITNAIERIKEFDKNIVLNQVEHLFESV